MNNFIRNRLMPIASATMIALAAIATARTAEAGAKTAPPPALSDTTPVVQALVLGLRNNRGEVICSLFNHAKGFPLDREKALRTVTVPIRNRRATCNFTGIPAGVYAIVLLHDEGAARGFDHGRLVMPKEGYGFSRDAAALFTPPTFNDAKFHYDGTRLYMIINMRY